ATFADELRCVGGVTFPDSLKEVAMRNIWMNRLVRASTFLAMAGIGIAAMGLGASAEAREDGYWDGWGYHHYYSSSANRYYYGYNYAPVYYYAPRTYAPPVYAYSYSYPHYYGRWAP